MICIMIRGISETHHRKLTNVFNNEESCINEVAIIVDKKLNRLVLDINQNDRKLAQL